MSGLSADPPAADAMETEEAGDSDVEIEGMELEEEADAGAADAEADEDDAGRHGSLPRLTPRKYQTQKREADGEQIDSGVTDAEAAHRLSHARP